MEARELVLELANSFKNTCEVHVSHRSRRSFIFIKPVDRISFGNLLIIIICAQSDSQLFLQL